MEELTTVKYTISKLIDKLTWAEHTAGTLQAENDQLRKELKEVEESRDGLQQLFDMELDAISKLEKLYKEKTGEDAPFLLF